MTKSASKNIATATRYSGIQKTPTTFSRESKYWTRIDIKTVFDNYPPISSETQIDEIKKSLEKYQNANIVEIKDLKQRALAGGEKSQFDLAIYYIYKSQTNYEEAFKLLEESAINGFAAAQYVLGRIILNHSKTDQNNISDAFELFEKAAEQGLPSAILYSLSSYFNEERNQLYNDKEKVIKHIALAVKNKITSNKLIARIARIFEAKDFTSEQHIDLASRIGHADEIDTQLIKTIFPDYLDRIEQKFYSTDNLSDKKSALCNFVSEACKYINLFKDKNAVKKLTELAYGKVTEILKNYYKDFSVSELIDVSLSALEGFRKNLSTSENIKLEINSDGVRDVVKAYFNNKHSDDEPQKKQIEEVKKIYIFFGKEKDLAGELRSAIKMEIICPTPTVNHIMLGDAKAIIDLKEIEQIRQYADERGKGRRSSSPAKEATGSPSSKSAPIDEGTTKLSRENSMTQDQ